MNVLDAPSEIPNGKKKGMILEMHYREHITDSGEYISTTLEIVIRGKLKVERGQKVTVNFTEE